MEIIAHLNSMYKEKGLREFLMGNIGERFLLSSITPGSTSELTFEKEGQPCIIAENCTIDVAPSSLLGKQFKLVSVDFTDNWVGIKADCKFILESEGSGY